VHKNDLRSIQHVKVNSEDAISSTVEILAFPLLPYFIIMFGGVLSYAILSLHT
jgi:hypothetical protein